MKKCKPLVRNQKRAYPFGSFGSFGSDCGLGFGGGCDPFAGFDLFGFGFGFDPFGCSSFFGGESREQCIARHRQACDLEFAACLSALVVGGLVFFAGCDLATLIAGLPACAVLTSIIGVVGGGGCVLVGTACMLRAQDGCPP